MPLSDDTVYNDIVSPATNMAPRMKYGTVPSSNWMSTTEVTISRRFSKYSGDRLPVYSINVSSIFTSSIKSILISVLVNVCTLGINTYS